MNFKKAVEHRTTIRVVSAGRPPQRRSSAQVIMVLDQPTVVWILTEIQCQIYENLPKIAHDANGLGILFEDQNKEIKMRTLKLV